jgi:hypothetical protein
MIVKYYHEITAGTNEGWQCVESHNKWVLKDEDDLTSDILYVMDFVMPVLYVKRHVSDQDKYPSFEKIEEDYRANWFLKEPYPIDVKKDAGFVLCGSHATVGIFYFFKIDQDYCFKKYNLVLKALQKTLQPIWGNRIVRKQDPVNGITRDDILIDNKKIAGLDWMIGETRVDLSIGIQNRYTGREEGEIKYLLRNDPNFMNNPTALDGITGAGFKVEDLINNLQIEADKIYNL